MAFTFPSSPATNDTYSVGSRTYTWTGTKWVLSGGIITSTQIEANAITTAKIAANAVTEAKIGAGAVTQAKLTSGLSGITVTTTALRDTVIPSPFAGQFAFLTDTNAFIRWNGSAWVTAIVSAPTEAPTSLALDSATTTTATISFAAGADGGSEITNYQYALSTNSGASYGSYNALNPADASSPITITGLTAGTAYYLKLKAVNAQGASNVESSALSFNTSLPVEYLVVGGGGGGGWNQGSAGGAGGMRSTVTATGGGGTLESALSLAVSTNYTVTVGGGGGGGSNGSGATGSNSVFSTVTSSGGGNGVPFYQTGGNGGSGGGGGTGGGAGTGTANQGFNGAAGGSHPSGITGGGGGAGAAATNQNGGAGTASSISGSSVTYAGGGGGGNSQAQANVGTGGTGGGGNGGSNANGSNGTANLGGGGGGGGNNTSTGFNGGNGGSGIVILRYPNTFTITLGAGLTGSTSTVGSNKVTTLTAGSGNVSWA